MGAVLYDIADLKLCDHYCRHGTTGSSYDARIG